MAGSNYSISYDGDCATLSARIKEKFFENLGRYIKINETGAGRQIHAQINDH